MKIITQSVHFDADQKLLNTIEQKLTTLDTYFHKIIQVDVTLRLENSGQVKGKTVEVKLQVPGEVIYISDKKLKFEAALDAVVDKLKRKVIKYKEQMRSR